MCRVTLASGKHGEAQNCTLSHGDMQGDRLKKDPFDIALVLIMFCFYYFLSMTGVVCVQWQIRSLC